jgi:hypothetical protein
MGLNIEHSSRFHVSFDGRTKSADERKLWQGLQVNQTSVLRPVARRSKVREAEEVLVLVEQ